MTRPHLPFLDWMKALGMALIVYGHVSTTADHLIPPIYPKQLGVAFFLFATGYSLARETRARAEVIFNRLFEIFLYGIGCALVMSAVTYAQKGDLNESNYLPFFLGANVAFDAFPANPTTWFIGTYIHIILIWSFLLRGMRIRPWMVVASAVAEIPIRALISQSAGPFVAYMAFPNWSTVFLLGLLTGQTATDPERPAAGFGRYAVALGLLVAGWHAISRPWVSEFTFPFMRPAIGPQTVAVAAMSLAVTLVYMSFTWLTYQVTRRRPASAVATFFARNTLFIFIAHMPLFYALRGPLGRWTGNYGAQVAAQFTANYILLAFISELLARMIRPKRLRDGLRRLIFGDRNRHESPMGTRKEKGSGAELKQ